MRAKFLSPQVRIACLLSAFMPCLTFAASAQAGTTVYEPASNWQVDNEPQLCRLSRDYQSGEARVTIRMEQFQPGAGVQIMLIGKPIEKAENRVSFQVRLGSAGVPFSAPVADITFRNGQEGTLLRSVQFVKPDRTSTHTWPSTAVFEAIDQIAFSAPQMGTVVLQTKSLAKAMEQMRLCHQRMVASWGFNPAVQENLSRHATPQSDPRLWLTKADFPVRQKRRGRSSIVTFRLDIDTAGKPTACYVQRAYTPEDYAATTCGLLMQRATFSPALDQAGKPVASYYVNGVGWLTF